MPDEWRSSRAPGDRAHAEVEQADCAVYQPPPVTHGQHVPCERADPREPAHVHHRLGLLIGIGVDEIDVPARLGVSLGAPDHRVGGEKAPIGPRDESVDHEAADDLPLAEPEPLREAGDVHHDLPGAIAPDPAYTTGPDAGRIRPIKEAREVRPLVGHEQLLDVRFVIERIDRRNRELQSALPDPSPHVKAKHVLPERHDPPGPPHLRERWPDSCNEQESGRTKRSGCDSWLRAEPASSARTWWSTLSPPGTRWWSWTTCRRGGGRISPRSPTASISSRPASRMPRSAAVRWRTWTACCTRPRPRRSRARWARPWPYI